MPQITFRDASGNSQTVEAEVGQSLMEVAVSNGVPGIDADCGGACACATCHVILEPHLHMRFEHKSETEASMLEFAEHVQPHSRLSCQVKVTEELDGLVVVTPPSQG